MDNSRLPYPITGPAKPTIEKNIQDKWQTIINLLAKSLDVPAGLIMMVHRETIEVFLSSETEGNPYHPGDSEHLNSGLYCETVMKTGKELHVPNALKDPDWDHNPDIKLGMINYLGLPLKWPDGETFGTICVLDRKEHHYSEKYRELLSAFCSTIDADLRLLVEIQERKMTEEENRKLIAELRQALDNVKQLRQLLPICSYCKKVRDDEGYWQQLDQYLVDHSDTTLSHGICPDCIGKAKKDFGIG